MELLKLSHHEWLICDKAKRKAYFSKSIDFSYIAYVYFISYRGNIIYIGCTCNPHIRDRDHLKKFYRRNYVIEFVGPFCNDLAYKIESAEIARRSRSKYLLNKSCKNKSYGKIKEFSIENFRQKSVSIVRERGKVKEVVC